MSSIVKGCYFEFCRNLSESFFENRDLVSLIPDFTGRGLLRDEEGIPGFNKGYYLS